MQVNLLIVYDNLLLKFMYRVKFLLTVESTLLPFMVEKIRFI
jgi:hypothetical protein